MNMHSRFPPKIIALIFAFLPVFSWADADEHRHQEAHVHGLAELTMAQDGNTLELELESPAVNIVGFEHKASTPEQIHTVERAKAVLESPQTLLVFSGTSCELKQAVVDVSALMGSDEDGHAHHDNESEKHDEHHHEHSEITAHYRFECRQGSQLTSLSVEFFKHFPGIEKLHVMWVTDTQQGAAELTAQSRNIRLR